MRRQLRRLTHGQGEKPLGRAMPVEVVCGKCLVSGAAGIGKDNKTEHPRPCRYRPDPLH